MQTPILFCSHQPNRYKTDKFRAAFSQWYTSQFEEEHIYFTSCEQYMMYHKALLMGDSETANTILKTREPDEIKKLGRKVKNFNEKLWNQNKFNVVVKGNYLKFSQNKELKELLLSTKNRNIYEAAGYDKIWGIGLNEQDALKIAENEWLDYGQNLLGKALMKVRELLKE